MASHIGRPDTYFQQVYADGKKTVEIEKGIAAHKTRLRVSMQHMDGIEEIINKEVHFMIENAQQIDKGSRIIDQSRRNVARLKHLDEITMRVCTVLKQVENTSKQLDFTSYYISMVAD